jgi:hypothetical protein
MGRVSAVFLLLLVVYTTTSEAQSTATDRHGVSTTRLLRGQNEMMEARDTADSTVDEERNIGATKAVGTLVKAMRKKAKLIIMLKRGFPPAKALTKLKVENLNGNSFNTFARYYAKYLSKYPKKAASLPATAEEAALSVKMQGWLKERVFPPQIGKKLQEFGQKDISRYSKEYAKMWGSKQAKLSGR